MKYNVSYLFTGIGQNNYKRLFSIIKSALLFFFFIALEMVHNNNDIKKKKNSFKTIRIAIVRVVAL